MDITVGVLDKTKLVAVKTMLQKKPPRPKSMHISPTSHGSGMQGLRSISQKSPSIFGGHSHMNPTGSGVQVPPFKHGLGSHKSISSVQFSPAYPCSQLQVNVVLPSSQEIVLF